MISSKILTFIYFLYAILLFHESLFLESMQEWRRGRQPNGGVLWQFWVLIILFRWLIIFFKDHYYLSLYFFSLLQTPSLSCPLSLIFCSWFSLFTSSYGRTHTLSVFYSNDVIWNMKSKSGISDTLLLLFLLFR